MTAAPDEPDVLMKTDVDGVVMRNVDAKPDPPCVEILEDASRAKARRIAGSIDDDGIFGRQSEGQLRVEVPQDRVLLTAR